MYDSDDTNRNQVSNEDDIPLESISKLQDSVNLLNLLRSAIDEIPLGITLADLSGKIVLSNKGESDIHGYANGELLGKDVSVFTGDASPKSSQKVQDWKAWSREVLSTRKDGSKVYIELTSNAIKSRTLLEIQ
jgi:PAS domain S-box-containing protein